MRRTQRMHEGSPTPTALVVDDDDAIRIALAETLSEDGFRVRCARDGVEAMAAMNEGQPRPDIVLLDLMMPRMNGWDVLSAMAASPSLRALPVVILTAFGELEVPEGTVSLHKPFDPAVLLDLVHARIGPAAPSGAPGP